MSLENPENDELVELLLRFTSGDQLVEQQLHRLDELLINPEHAAAAVAFLDLQAGLHDAHHVDLAIVEHNLRSTLATQKPHLQLLPASDKPNWLSKFPVIGVLAATVLIFSNLLVGAIVWYSVSKPVAEKPRLTDQSTALASSRAPQVVSMTACVWSPTVSRKPVVGRSIAKGETLHLLEGIAELDFGQGDSNRARVRLEGPGSIFTQSDGLLRLNFGALTADVSWRDGPFLIETPAGRVVINGSASIGIVANAPQNEVHVFEGDVMIEASSSDGAESMVHLGPGEAASLAMARGQDANVTLFDASSNSFATSRSMAFDRLEIGQPYRDLIKQANPAIYWQFETAVDDQVINHGSLEGFNAYIDGAVSWRQFGENRAAEFGLTGTVGAFVSRKTWPEKPLDNYTIEMWIKPSHFHNGALICLVDPKPMVGGRHPHGMFLEMGGEFDPKSPNPALTNVRFVHRPVPSVDRTVGTSLSVKKGYRVRAWQHVVARKDGDDLELIIDGRVVAHKKNALPLPAKMQFVIGQLFPKLTYRPFVGQIDEIAIYERALTNEEVKQHFEMAKPSVALDDRPADEAM